MALTASFDQSSYAPGDQIVLTVLDDARSTVEVATVTAADQSTASAEASILTAQPTVSSSTGRVYTVQSDDGVTTIFVTTA